MVDTLQIKIKTLVSKETYFRVADIKFETIQLTEKYRVKGYYFKAGSTIYNPKAYHR